MPQWKENRSSIFRHQFAKNLELGFVVLFCFVLIKEVPHNLQFLHILIIQFQTTKLIAQAPHGKAPSQQDRHRFHHERAARCPPPFFSAWVATRFINPHQVVGEGSAPTWGWSSGVGGDLRAAVDQCTAGPPSVTGQQRLGLWAETRWWLT